MEYERILDYLTQISIQIDELTSPPNRVILSNKDFCELMQICPKTAQKWRDNGYIRHSKIGREIYYKLSDVLDMLENFKRESFINQKTTVYGNKAA